MSVRKNKGTPYRVRCTWMGNQHEPTVYVPDDFDRVRGSHDVARDLAAEKIAGPGAKWVAGASRCDGVFRWESGAESAPVRMVVECERVSPSGCPIEAGEPVHKVPTFRVVRCGDRVFNEQPFKACRTTTEALQRIVSIANNGEHYRVVRIPAGEPWDYDGTIVASLRLGAGVE